MEKSKFLIVNFNCLNDQCPVTLEGIDIFERANTHLKIGVTVLQYEIEFEEGHRSDKKGVLFPVSFQIERSYVLRISRLSLKSYVLRLRATRI